MSTGISLTEEEANVLRDLDNRLSKVKSVKLHIPSPRKDLPTGYGYTRPSSAFDNYLNNNNNSNNTSNNISSNYLNHPTNTNTNDPLSSPPPSPTRRRSPFTSAITDPHARTHETHAHGTRAQARSAREGANASNHHQDLLNQLRKERRKVVEMGLHAHDNPDNPLSSRYHHDPSSASHYHPSASSSSSHRHSSTSRHRSSSASHHQSSTPHYAPSSSSSSPPSSPRHHHRSKSSKYFEKYQNEDGNNNNNNKYEHNNNNNNYESKSNHKYEDNNGTDQENERERERERDRERERNIERERERESRIHGESKPPPPDGRKHGNQNKESSYFQEEELRELNERIKLIEMEFGVDPPCEDHPEKEKQRERSKETEREKEDKSDRVKRDSRPPIYNGYLSSLLAPYPPKLENASSRRMDYLPSDWTEEKSMLLPAPKFEVEELKPPISAKGKKARPPLPPPSEHSGPQQDRPSRKNKDPDSPPNPRSASPLFAKKREVSAFASPQKVRMMSEDYPKPILPPDRNTRASSIRNSFAKKKEAEAPVGERRDKKATKKTTGPRSMDDPRASLYGSFSPPMSRTQAKFSKNKRKTDVDDEKHDFTNTKSDICLAHSVKKERGNCPVCTSLRRK